MIAELPDRPARAVERHRHTARLTDTQSASLLTILQATAVREAHAGNEETAAEIHRLSTALAAQLQD